MSGIVVSHAVVCGGRGTACVSLGLHNDIRLMKRERAKATILKHFAWIIQNIHINFG